MSWIHMIPLAAVASVPITIAVLELIHYAAQAKPQIKHWPPNYWW